MEIYYKYTYKLYVKYFCMLRGTAGLYRTN